MDFDSGFDLVPFSTEGFGGAFEGLPPLPPLNFSSPSSLAAGPAMHIMSPTAVSTAFPARSPRHAASQFMDHSGNRNDDGVVSSLGLPPSMALFEGEAVDPQHFMKKIAVQKEQAALRAKAIAELEGSLSAKKQRLEDSRKQLDALSHSALEVNAKLTALHAEMRLMREVQASNEQCHSIMKQKMLKMDAIVQRATAGAARGLKTGECVRGKDDPLLFSRDHLFTTRFLKPVSVDDVAEHLLMVVPSLARNDGMPSREAFLSAANSAHMTTATANNTFLPNGELHMKPVDKLIVSLFQIKNESAKKETNRIANYPPLPAVLAEMGSSALEVPPASLNLNRLRIRDYAVAYEEFVDSNTAVWKSVVENDDDKQGVRRKEEGLNVDADSDAIRKLLTLLG